jgi:hypothetical protein
MPIRVPLKFLPSEEERKKRDDDLRNKKVFLLFSKNSNRIDLFLFLFLLHRFNLLTLPGHFHSGIYLKATINEQYQAP